MVKYSRTTRVDKRGKVCDIVFNLRACGPNYLRHRSHVDKIASVLRLIRDSFDDKYIELDLSENIAMKPKFVVQEVHLSGRQYLLHCTLIQPAETEYIYHLSAGTRHDPAFDDEVLEDISKEWNIKNETITVNVST